MRHIYYLLIIALLFVVSSISAENRGRAHFEIEIARIDSSEYGSFGVIQGTIIKIPIIVNKATHKISGFDFTIDYDINALTLINAQPGNYLTQNNWELLEYEFLPDTIFIIDSICPAIRIRGSIGENNNLNSPPANIKPGDTLAVMSFYVTSDLTLDCQIIPISFFWGNCDANIINSWPIEKVYYPSRIYNSDDSLIFDSDSAPPSFNSDCIYSGSDRGRGFNKRSINYKNGRVRIICTDDIDGRWSRGDINLNGIVYEVADAVIFQNYFMEGLNAFTINVVPQTAATDVNDDGITLTISDLVFMKRIIFGESIPSDGPNLEPFPGLLQINGDIGTVNVTTKFEKQVTAVFLCFYAPDNIKDVKPAESASNMIVGYHQIDDTLRILVYNFEEYVIPNEEAALLSIEHEGTKPRLAYASASGMSGENVDLRIIENFPFAIKIGKVEDVFLGHHVYVPVKQISGNAQNHGFDFLISYDNAALAFMGAYGDSTLFTVPGEYEWEYFTYRFVDNCGGECPSGLLQIVGIADQNNGTHHPLNVTLPNNMTLFTMDFMVTNDYTMDGKFIPLDFFWRDCTDNSIAALLPGGYLSDIFQAVSNDVFSGTDGSVITDKLASFPTIFGAPDECIVIQANNKIPVRFIDFYNGGVKIIETEEVDDRGGIGDINLNGKSYEIADAIIFSNYFIYGLDVFTVDVDKQVANSDVNRDGIPLTVEDFALMIRLIIGDILPIDQIGDTIYSGSLNIQEEESLTKINTNFEKNTGALQLCFYAPDTINQVRLNYEIGYMHLKYQQINDTLKILIYSFDKGATIPDGETFLLNIFHSGTKPILTQASASGYYGEKVDLTIDYSTGSSAEATLPIKFELYQNFPNPFNPNTEIKFSLPRSSDVTLDIYDITGRKVTTLISNKLSSGPHSIVWNGRDANGNEASSGIYLYRISTENYSDTKKMLLLK